MLDAKHGKALRGDLRISVPIGYIWHREIGLGLDPNLRVQEAVRVVFARFRQLGSARQVLLSLRYLTDVLERLPTQPASQLDELLPHHWQPRS